MQSRVKNILQKTKRNVMIKKYLIQFVTMGTNCDKRTLGG